MNGLSTIQSKSCEDAILRYLPKKLQIENLQKMICQEILQETVEQLTEISNIESIFEH